MAKTILTPTQFKVLELLAQEKRITSTFYLTGGTALSEFYLQHRLSEDLDLFTEIAEVEPKVVESFLKKISPQLEINKIKRTQFLGLISYLLMFENGLELKVDFNYYPFPRINKGKKFQNLEIDSLYDIAVNKVHTLFMRPRPRDYIDLFFILKKERGNYSLKKLILDAKAKFDWDIDRITLASQFLRSLDLKMEGPKMLVPFDLKEIREFFLQEAKNLKDEIF